jgi:LmbE family N-acetylglucosaminyl deacetylase
VATTIKLDLNDAEEARLEALAKARGRSTIQCLRDFIASCQPNGSGWTHPDHIRTAQKTEKSA